MKNREGQRMKRIIAILIAIVTVSSFAFAETGLSSMAYDDLISMYHEIVKEIMSRPEWKEVEVPSGHWIGGEDIPEGEYSIKATAKLTIVCVTDLDGHFETYQTLGEGDMIGKVIIKKGYSIEIGKPVIFAPVATVGF